MRKITPLDRLRYQFDLTMARGAGALIAWLLIATALVIAAAATVVVSADVAPAEDGHAPGFATVLWTTLMRALDAGNVAGDAGSRVYIGVMFFVTLAGIFVVSILIGLITSGIQGRLEQLRKGRSVVCEEGHTVVLGFTPQIFSILSELAIANASRKGAVVAILADKDKVEMEDALAAKALNLGKTRVVCRTGSPLDPDDIQIVRPDAARSIIVLGPDEGDPDPHVIKAILALTNGAQRKASPYHIVAAIRDPRNMEAAKLVGRDEAKILPAEELLARITVQTCRQAGLSTVYTELLDFDGDEIYLRREPSLTGTRFGDALFAYPTCTVLGLLHAGGKVALKPPMDTVIAADDALILVAEDDSKIALGSGARSGVDDGAIREGAAAVKTPERTLILGWNRRGPMILRELDAYVAEGSSVRVVADTPDVEAAIAQVRGDLVRLSVTFEEGDTTLRRTLDALTREPYDHVITLSYADTLGTQEADAKTLVTLLHLRDIESRKGESFSVVSEMLDVRNRRLAEVTQVDDFIVSDKLLSLLLAQVSESPELAAVFADLFDPKGAELYLKPAGDYVEMGKEVSFATVVEAARRRGEVALGFRIAAKASDRVASYGVRVNPPKSERAAFAEGDRVIVLADD
jgi:voltage-gated potassium channel Kch